jgi:hypothetical protein
MDHVCYICSIHSVDHQLQTQRWSLVMTANMEHISLTLFEDLQFLLLHTPLIPQGLQL